MGALPKAEGAVNGAWLLGLGNLWRNALSGSLPRCVSKTGSRIFAQGQKFSCAAENRPYISRSLATSFVLKG
jgi:hypothetical protein